ncbi:MAG: hypothetical protein H6704_30630 [Myxococcales bacterium]|nr:hypothetical protein [Myxococcales bacterium]
MRQWARVMWAVAALGCGDDASVGGPGGGGGDAAPEDAGPAPADARAGGGRPVGATCFDHVECQAGLVCALGACGAAFPRTYSLSFTSISLAETNARGEPWDPAGGLPDPYVVLMIDGAEVHRTPTLTDVRGATWRSPVEVELDAGSALSFAVFDADPEADADEAVGEVDVPNIGVVVRNGGFRGQVPSLPAIVEFDLSVTPR